MTWEWGFTLGEIQGLFNIIGSASLGIALAAYFYKKRQDEFSLASEIVSFFREKIVYEGDLVRKKIYEKDKGFIISRIKIPKNCTIRLLKDDAEQSENFERQLRIFFDSNKNYPDIVLDTTVLDRQIFLLNMLEEFALKALTFEDYSFKFGGYHPLGSLKNAFVEIVEQNAVALFFMRDVQVGSEIYSSILRLYEMWHPLIPGNSSRIKRLAVSGLINKKQRDDLYKKRDKKFNLI
ncbi:MAG: hypothetical protein AMXMBFR44_4620 [Candidatus Campbellbacteria bacterium]